MIETRPVTADRWDDLLALFGERGAYSGCWCMWWRQTAAEFDAGAGAGNREQMRALVADDRVPGLLGYVDGQPVGWVSVAPRSEFGRVERSPHLKAVDDQPAWSIVCFYIDRAHRRQGVAAALLRSAVQHAADRGARIVEGYPIDDGDVDDASVYTGTVSMFRRAGFEEAAHRGGKRRIMRLVV